LSRIYRIKKEQNYNLTLRI